MVLKFIRIKHILDILVSTYLKISFLVKIKII